MDFGIVHLEMLNILVALHTWGHCWAGKAILVHRDNQAVVSVIQSGKTKDLTLAALGRNIAMATATYDIDLRTIHILGKNNTIADALSRWALVLQYYNRFYSLCPDHYWVYPNEDDLYIDWSI